MEIPVIYECLTNQRVRIVMWSMPADALLLRFRKVSELYHNGELPRRAANLGPRLLRELKRTVRIPCC